jgi:hypothetical protein
VTKRANRSLENREVGAHILERTDGTAFFVAGPDASPARKKFSLVYSSEFSYVHEPEKFIASVSEMIQPGGRAIVAAFSENSYRHWITHFLRMGMVGGLLNQFSMAAIVAQECGNTSPAPSEGLEVRLYRPEQLKRLFKTSFDTVRVHRRLFDWTVIIEASNTQ